MSQLVYPAALTINSAASCMQLVSFDQAAVATYTQVGTDASVKTIITYVLPVHLEMVSYPFRDHRRHIVASLKTSAAQHDRRLLATE